MTDRIKDFVFQKIFQDKIEQDKKTKRLITILTLFFAVVVIFIIIVTPVISYQYFYQNKIYAGVLIDDVNISGLTKNQAITKLNQQADIIKQHGLNFYYQDYKKNIALTTVSADDPDLVFEILDFDTEQIAEKAYQYGRNDDWLVNFIKQAQALLNNHQIDLTYTINEKELKDVLQQEFSQFEQPAKNAQIIYKQNQITFSEEKNGQVFDYGAALKKLKENINLQIIDDIELKITRQNPTVTKAEAQTIIPKIRSIIEKEKIILKYEEQQWPINNDQYKNWLALEKENDDIVVMFDQEKLIDKIEQISLSINTQPQDAKMILEDGKVIKFLPSKNGLELAKQESVEKINYDFFENDLQEIELVVLEKEPNVKTEEINDFGIKEVIGVGVSDFSGSSSNRIGNITTASNKLNGMLIKPDEEFSLVDRIGEVSAATGYFAEWVIKGDRTIKEFGGGLCQIATTTFRAAIYSGLPITERKPHSYIVSYYKPIGFDAAIYGPHPDVRFINDTGHYILFQTEMKGTELKFTFWGTSDGRQVEVTKPEVYNWRGAPPAKLIPNPDLEPGAKIFKEAARSGADAHFYRYLTLPGQEKQEEIYRSHYVAWPAIYEVGLDPEPTEETAEESEQTDQSDQQESGQTGQEAGEELEESVDAGSNSEITNTENNQT